MGNKLKGSGTKANWWRIMIGSLVLGGSDEILQTSVAIISDQVPGAVVKEPLKAAPKPIETSFAEHGDQSAE